VCINQSIKQVIHRYLESNGGGDWTSVTTTSSTIIRSDINDSIDIKGGHWTSVTTTSPTIIGIDINDINRTTTTTTTGGSGGDRPRTTSTSPEP